MGRSGYPTIGQMALLVMVRLTYRQRLRSLVFGRNDDRWSTAAAVVLTAFPNG